MHYVWQAQLALFLLYRELFSNHELRDTCTLAPPHMTHSLCVASSACFFSIVPWTLFWLWPIITNYHQLSPIVHQFHQYFGLILIGLMRRFAIYIYICWGIETDTNYHQLSPIITYYHQFVHQCHQYYGLILIGLTRQFQKYVYVGVSKQIPIFTNYHQLSPICSPISPILWFNIDLLNEMIPTIYICWGIEADTNFHQLLLIITNLFTNWSMCHTGRSQSACIMEFMVGNEFTVQ